MTSKFPKHVHEGRHIIIVCKDLCFSKDIKSKVAVKLAVDPIYLNMLTLASHHYAKG